MEVEHISLCSLVLELSQQDSTIKVCYLDTYAIFAKQEVTTIKSHLIDNFEYVRTFYEYRLALVNDLNIDNYDLDAISIKLVIRYLYMYNIWNVSYNHKKKQDLIFKEEDFGDVVTFDIIANFFKNKYPADWERKSSVFLGMEHEVFVMKYREREKFYSFY